MTKRGRAGDLFSEVVVQILFLNGLLEAAGDGLSAAANQTTARWRVLAALDQSSSTVAAIARALGHKRQSVQRVADALFQEGALRYVDNPNDQRAQLAELTASGRKALTLIQEQQVAWAKRLGEQLGVTQLETLRTALSSLSSALTSQSSGEHE